MNREPVSPPSLQSDSVLEWLTGLALIGGGVVVGNAVTLLYVVPVDRLGPLVVERAKLDETLRAELLDMQS